VFAQDYGYDTSTHERKVLTIRIIKETKAVFGSMEPTRFQLALSSTVPGRAFNKRFLGELDMNGTFTDRDGTVCEIRGDQIFDNYGTRRYILYGNCVHDTYGTKIYEIRGDGVYDTYGNKVS